jgi:hypothetical protein
MMHSHGTCMCGCHTHAVQCTAGLASMAMDRMHAQLTQVPTQQPMDSKRPSERRNWPCARAGQPSCPSSLARAHALGGPAARPGQPVVRDTRTDTIGESRPKGSRRSAGAQGPPPPPHPRKSRAKGGGGDARGAGEQHRRDRDASQSGARRASPWGLGGSGSGSVGRCGHVTGLMACSYACARRTQTCLYLSRVLFAFSDICSMSTSAKTMCSHYIMNEQSFFLFFFCFAF